MRVVVVVPSDKPRFSCGDKHYEMMSPRRSRNKFPPEAAHGCDVHRIVIVFTSIFTMLNGNIVVALKLKFGFSSSENLYLSVHDFTWNQFLNRGSEGQACTEERAIF